MHTCGRARCVSDETRESGRMYIPHSKEPPYLTGQSHLIDTRRVPNTLRPPIRYSPLSLFLFLSFFLSFCLSISRFSLYLSFSLLSVRLVLPACGIANPASVARAALVTPVAAADFTSNHGNGNTSYACNAAPCGCVTIINGWRILPRARRVLSSRGSIHLRSLDKNSRLYQIE